MLPGAHCPCIPKEELSSTSAARVQSSADLRQRSVEDAPGASGSGQQADQAVGGHSGVWVRVGAERRAALTAWNPRVQDSFGTVRRTVSAQFVAQFRDSSAHSFGTVFFTVYHGKL